MKCDRMLAAVFALLMICSALSLPLSDPDLDSQFEEWKKKHEKVYSGPEEEAMRRKIWEETLKRVEAHNKEADQGLQTYRMGLNQFSDKTKEERQRGCAFPPLTKPVRVLDGEMEQHMNQTAVNSTDAAADGDQGGNSSKVPVVEQIVIETP